MKNLEAKSIPWIAKILLLFSYYLKSSSHPKWVASVDRLVGSAMIAILLPHDAPSPYSVKFFIWKYFLKFTHQAQWCNTTKSRATYKVRVSLLHFATLHAISDENTIKCLNSFDHTEFQMGIKQTKIHCWAKRKVISKLERFSNILLLIC